MHYRELHAHVTTCHYSGLQHECGLLGGGLITMRADLGLVDEYADRVNLCKQ